MALKNKISNIEDVDESLQGLYKQSGDSYVLDIEGTNNTEDLAKEAREAQARADKLQSDLEIATRTNLELKSKQEGKSKTLTARVEELSEQLEAQKAAATVATEDSTFSGTMNGLSNKIKPRFASIFEETELRKNWNVKEGKLVHKDGTYGTPEEHLTAWTKDIPEAVPTSTGGGVQEDEDDHGKTLDNFKDDTGNLDYAALEDATSDGKNPHLLEALSEY